MSTHRVIALDGGLATSGAVVVDTDGVNHNVVAVESFATFPSVKARFDHDIAEDRVRRAKEYAAWLESLSRFKAGAMAFEEMGYPKGHNTVVLIALGWGIFSSFLERHKMRHVAGSAIVCRNALVGKGKMPKGEKERIAQQLACRMVPSFIARSVRIDKGMLVHTLDALVVYCWSTTTNLLASEVPW